MVNEEIEIIPFIHGLLLNEIVYLYRFWFIILSVISGVALIYSLMVIMMPTTRESIIKRSYRSGQSKEISSLIRRLDVSPTPIQSYLY